MNRVTAALCAGLVMTSAALAAENTVPAPEMWLASLDVAKEDLAVSLPDLDQLKADDFIIEPASGVQDFVDEVRYNIEKLDVSEYSNYSFDTFVTQSDAIIWDIVGIYGLTTILGASTWDWGNSNFHFKNEGWFGEDTKYAGVDKIGHAYSGYLLTEYFSQRIAHTVEDRDGAIITGAILGMGVQSYIEFFDGFSGGHGFSYEDFIADGVGVGFSVLRNTVPGLADKVDFRLEYIQSEYSDFAPFTDYAGQKYFLALKLSGFEEFEDTPLRFVELQAGYFAVGYTDAEREAGVKQSRDPFFAIGLNLNELLGETTVADTLAGEAAGRAFEYLQVPYTYVPTATR